MKKWFAFALTVLIAAVAVPALADVTVTATIDKTKDKVVEEFLTKDKIVDINVISENLLLGAVEVEALVNVRNDGNTVDRDPREPGFQIDRHATLEGSVNENSGILGLNQDVGNMVNQANVVSFGFTNSPNAFSEAQAGVDQRNRDNTVFQIETAFDPEVPDRTATITDSGSGNAGIVGINQNAGNMNNQTNAVAVAVATNGFVGLAEADLGQLNAGNRVEEGATVKQDLITGSFLGHAGVLSVNQSSGNMNNQGTVVSLQVLTSPVPPSSIPR